MAYILRERAQCSDLGKSAEKGYPHYLGDSEVRKKKGKTSRNKLWNKYFLPVEKALINNKLLSVSILVLWKKRMETVEKQVSNSW